MRYFCGLEEVVILFDYSAYGGGGDCLYAVFFAESVQERLDFFFAYSGVFLAEFFNKFNNFPVIGWLFCRFGGFRFRG